MDSSFIRYKAYRLSKQLTLGRVYGGPLGMNVCRSLEEGAGTPVVSAHIAERWLVSPASVQRYPFPESFPMEFPRETAFDGKWIWRLTDVIAAPGTGLVRIPQGPILQQSAGSLPRLYNGRIADALRSPRKEALEGPLVLFPNAEYYHALMEHLPNVLLSRRFVPDARILLPVRRHSYLNRLLDFVGIPRDARLEAEGPVLVRNLVFAPLWVNSGFVPDCDLSAVRDAILPHIPAVSQPSERIYISRSRSRNRPLGRENDLERALEERGFQICYLETLSFEEQFAAIRGADLVVAPHGAGLANLVAARPGLHVLELLSRNWFNTCYAKLAVQLRCNYHFLDTVPCGDGYEVPLNAVLKEIDLP